MVKSASYANLTVQHAGLLNLIELEVAQDPWSEESFITHLAARDSVTVGVFLGGELAGFIAGQRIGERQLDIFQVAVARKFQRQGLAKGLIAHLRGAGYDTLMLEVRPSNTAALSLYQGEGFKLVGKRKNFYRDGEDAATMRWQANSNS